MTERMTDEEVMKELRSGSHLNRVREILSGVIGQFEQDALQQPMILPIERRRREFEAVKKIVAFFDVQL